MRTRILLAALAVGIMAPLPAAAQAFGNPFVFAGVDSVVPELTLAWDDRITGITRSQFVRQATDAFELGLVSAGLHIAPMGTASTGGKPWVVCTVNVLYDDGLIAYSKRVSYQELMLDQVTTQLGIAERWSDSSVGTVDMDNFDADYYGRDCAEKLELEWRLHN